MGTSIGSGERSEDVEPNCAEYTRAPEFLALLAAVRAAPVDRTARLVLADWVQDHDDEVEAAAIRESQSFRVDVAPGLVLNLASLTVRLIQLAALLCERPGLAASLVEIADVFHTGDGTRAQPPGTLREIGITLSATIGRGQ